MNILKKICFSIGMFAALPGLVYAAQGQGKNNVNNNSNSDIVRNVTITQPSVKAMPRTITWQESKNAQRGQVTNDHIKLDVYVYNGDLICTVDLTAAATSYTVNKKNCGEHYKVYSKYTVKLTEVRTDDSLSDVASEDFTTSPPRLKELLVRKRTAVSSSVANATLRWTMPTTLTGVTEKYEYKIVLYKDPSTIVAHGTETMAGQTIRVKNIPRKKLKYRVRVNSADFGAGRWSKWKVFSLKKI